MSDHRPPTTAGGLLPGFILAEALALAALATLPFDIRLPLISLHNVRVPILLFELPLFFLLILTFARLVRSRWRPRSVMSCLVLLLALLLVISAVVHPSWFVVLRLYRLAAAAAFGYWILRLLRGSSRGRVYAVVAALALFQSYLATGEHLLGKGMGYTFLGETEHLYRIGEVAYAQGTFPLHHILVAFTLAALGLLVQGPRRFPRLGRWWLVILVAATAPVGFAYSRMGLVGWFLLVVVLAVASIRQRRAFLALCIAVLFGGLLSGAVAAEGWAARTTETVEGDGPGGDDEGADVGGRIKFAIQALRVVEQQPLVGTGIGRYLTVARDQQGEEVQLPAHNVPLLVAAENGVIAGVFASALLAMLGIAAVRAGPLAIAAYVAYMPFVLLDHFPYEDTQGIVISGLWVAAVLAVSTSGSEA